MKDLPYDEKDISSIFNYSKQLVEELFIPPILSNIPSRNHQWNKSPTLKC